MKTSPFYLRSLLLLSFLLIPLVPVLAAAGPQSAPGQEDGGPLSYRQAVTSGQDPAGHNLDAGHNLPGHICTLPFVYAADPGPSVPAPAFDSRAAQTANITVNYIGPWTTPAQTAFEYAVSIWENLITSSVPIVVNAEFKSLGPGVLGGAGPYDYFANFTGAPQLNTWYAVALANARAAADLNGADPEIDSVFSSSFSWYYGTDGNTPANQVDFATVVLHELGHGLGFAGSAEVISGFGYWGRNTAFPFSYDRFAENLSGAGVTSYIPPSAALAADLTSNNMFFDGPRANVANGGGRVPIYAPTTWQQGSSYSHLDEDYNGTSNDLMTYSVSNGVAIHNPGPVAMGILQDTGWTVKTAPVFSQLPDLLMVKNTTRNNAINLPAFVSDDSPDSSLTFAVVSGSSATLTVTIDGSDNVDLTASSNWTGTATVTVRATDPDGLSTDSSFDVTVVDQILELYMPIVVR